MINMTTKRIFTHIALSAAVVLLILLPFIASAQLVPCSGLDCTACDFVDMGNGILKWLVGILFIVFAIILFIGGWGMVTSAGNTSAKEAAKSKISSALIGILIVLAAWLMVDTLLRALLPSDTGEITGFGFWATVECDHTMLTPEIVYRYGDEGGADTFAPGNPDLGAIGSGNAAIVQCAQAFDAKRCLYSKANRNGCTGTPGYTDCSDLVNNCFQAAGCGSPGGSTAAQYPVATAIGAPSTLKPGDSIVYRYPCGASTCGHVVICMNDGCSQVIHASGRGAPDGQPAKVPAADQIKISNGEYYYTKSAARVLRAADFCP